MDEAIIQIAVQVPAVAISLLFAFGVIRLVIQTYGQRLEKAITLLEELMRALR